MDEQVECRSDYEYAQRPLAFTWQGQRLEIQEVIAEYMIPTGKHFIVTTDQAGCFNLFYDIHIDQWTIQSTLSKENA